jgi:hypothetical protein
MPLVETAARRNSTPSLPFSSLAASAMRLLRTAPHHASRVYPADCACPTGYRIFEIKAGTVLPRRQALTKQPNLQESQAVFSPCGVARRNSQ